MELLHNSHCHIRSPFRVIFDNQMLSSYLQITHILSSRQRSVDLVRRDQRTAFVKLLINFDLLLRRIKINKSHFRKSKMKIFHGSRKDSNYFNLFVNALNAFLLPFNAIFFVVGGQVGLVVSDLSSGSQATNDLVSVEKCG